MNQPKAIRAIEEIALQTNLLALNAAVAAAHAAGGGANFAALAQDVRQAANETVLLIRNSGGELSPGEAAGELTLEASRLHGMIEHIRELVAGSDAALPPAPSPRRLEAARRIARHSADIAALSHALAGEPRSNAAVPVSTLPRSRRSVPLDGEEHGI